MSSALTVNDCLLQLPADILPLSHDAYQIRPLAGGVGNATFHLLPKEATFPHHAEYVLRIHNPQLDFSVCREQELQGWRFAAAIGRAPQLYYWSEQQDFSLSAYINESDRPSTYQPTPLLALLSELHSLPLPAPDISYNERIDGYWQTICWTKVAQRGIDPTQLTALRRLTAGWLHQMQLSALPLCFCHHDLTPGNLLWHNQQWIAIDFEYAGLGHPLFELAAIAETLNNPARMTQLWLAYLNQQSPQFNPQIERIAWQAAQQLYAFISLLWTLSKQVNPISGSHDTLLSRRPSHACELAAMSRYYLTQLKDLVSQRKP